MKTTLNTLNAETIGFHGSDGKALHTCRWMPESEPRAAIQIAHGMGEHIARYQPVAARLNAAGYVVYGNDHRGHGRTDPDRLGSLGDDGWNRVIDDARRLNERIGRDFPGVKRVLLGHSMGAMMAQQYLCRHGSSLDVAVLSGSPGLQGRLQTAITGLVTRFEAWRLGDDAESEVLSGLLFGQANRDFDGDGATGFEWLSRDAVEVRKYVDDPHCGTVLRTGSLLALFRGAREAAKPANIAAIPKDLPIHVLSGTADPVHGEQKNLKRLFKRYTAAGLRVSRKLYHDGRHEMFNEINRVEVLDDLVAWLDDILLDGVPPT